MAKIGSIALDLGAVEEGKWVTHPSGVRLRIASVNSRAYKEARERLLRPHLRDLRSGRLTTDDILEIVKPAVAEHLLLEWAALEDDAGKPIPYSPAKALEYFRDRRFVEFFRFVLEIAGEEEEFRQQTLEESAKNLPTSSAGISSGGIN